MSRTLLVACGVFATKMAIVNMFISRLQTPVDDVTLSMPILHIVSINNSGIHLHVF